MAYIHWGRNSNTSKDTGNAKFQIFLAIGCVLVIFCAVHASFDKPEYAEVVAGFNPYGEDEALAEPFGYFMGEWNLWEFIGDTVSSLIQ